MKNWLSELLQRKFNGETDEQKAIRRILEMDDDQDRKRMNPVKPWKEGK